MIKKLLTAFCVSLLFFGCNRTVVKTPRTPEKKENKIEKKETKTKENLQKEIYIEFEPDNDLSLEKNKIKEKEFVLPKVSDTKITFDETMTSELPPYLYTCSKNKSSTSFYKDIYNLENCVRIELPENFSVIPVCFAANGESIDGEKWIKVLLPDELSRRQNDNEFYYAKASELSEYYYFNKEKNDTDEKLEKFISERTWKKINPDGKLDVFCLDAVKHCGTDFTFLSLDKASFFEYKIEKENLFIKKQNPENEKAGEKYSIKIISLDEIELNGERYEKTIHLENFGIENKAYLFDIYRGKTFMQFYENLMKTESLKIFLLKKTNENKFVKECVDCGVYCDGTKYKKDFDDEWKEKIINADEKKENEYVYDDEEYIKEVKKLIKPCYTKPVRKRYEAVPDELKRFYRNDKKLYTTMMVCADDGLKVRAVPDMNAEKICVLPDKFIVTIAALGEKVKADGIESAWIEIVLPRYMWKERTTQEYGWIFGGYLKETEVEPFSLTKNIPEKAGGVEDEWETYFAPEFTGKRLYDIDVNGQSVCDNYLSRNKLVYNEYLNFYKSEKASEFAYKNDRYKNIREMLKYAFSGVYGENEEYKALFDAYWHCVQEMRSCYPVRISKPAKKETVNKDFNSIIKNLKKNSEYYFSDFELNNRKCETLYVIEPVKDSDIRHHYCVKIYIEYKGEVKLIYSIKTEPVIVSYQDIYLTEHIDSGRLYAGFSIYSECGLLEKAEEQIFLDEKK